MVEVRLRKSNNINGTVRWTVHATSAKTGCYHYFCHRQKCKRFPSPISRKKQPFIIVELYFNICYNHLNKLEFGGQWPLTMRAKCSTIRYCPNPLGIVTAEQLDKLEFGGESPLTMRARCSTFRYCPNPLGIVTAERLDKSEFLF